jgi:GPN-loop GTPase
LPKIWVPDSSANPLSTLDISELVTVQDIMEELRYGPNGGLLYALEYLAENTDWLKEQLGDFEDDYLIIDCPGQIELYTHIPVMTRIFSELQSWGYSLVSLYLIDSQFMTDTSKFISASLMCLSAMLQFELPHLNVITKMDLLGSKGDSDDMEKFFTVDVRTLTAELNKSMRPDFRELNLAIATVVDDFNMVSYLPLNIKDDESIAAILYQIDTATQYGETEEPKEPGDGDVDFDEYGDAGDDE